MKQVFNFIKKIVSEKEQIGELYYLPDQRNQCLGHMQFATLYRGDVIIILETQKTSDVWRVLTKYGVGILYCGDLSKKPFPL